jgi:hypothetical protein
VSVLAPDGPSTVLFRECVAAVRYPDGGRHLIGADAIAVEIEPALYALPPDTPETIDAALPPESLIDLPSREASAVVPPVPRKPFPLAGPTLIAAAAAVVFGVAAVLTHQVALAWAATACALTIGYRRWLRGTWR